MNLPDGYEQLELFSETRPDPKPKKKKWDEPLILSREEAVIIEVLQDVIQDIQRFSDLIREYTQPDEFDEYMESAARSIVYYLRVKLGIPEGITRAIVLPLFNVPNAESEYLLEYLLEAFNPKLHEKYLMEKEAFFNQLFSGGDRT